MLDEYKQLCLESADLIPNWKKLSKVELANLYVENEDKPISNSYLSAILYKYWSLINTFYYKQGVKTATEFDCYSWVVDGICKALKEKAWLDPTSSIYNDAKGPEKAIMVCISCTRANFYVYAKYDKRKANYDKLSLEALEEASSDGFFIPYEDKTDDTIDDYCEQLILTAFNNKDVVKMFFLYSLFNKDIIKETDNLFEIDIKSFNRKSALTEDCDFNYLAKICNTTEEEITKCLNRFNITPEYKIHSKISTVLRDLKTDTLFKELLLEKIHGD